MTASEREYQRLAAAVADWPVLIRRILDQHDATGTCRACTTPGGRMVIKAPCAPRFLAMQAQVINYERAELIGNHQ
ncbi:hypothetical protein [Pseudonocardia sp. MH-G8]|uniref:hypothetical protein n=1 Tax=Pseudonocardia sp. MH-G8 TaxID=1854588 RepID=UPI00117B4677|nr:hypothetical protein [Pseudonocardia sp. MH-G8]